MIVTVHTHGRTDARAHGRTQSFALINTLFFLKYIKKSSLSLRFLIAGGNGQVARGCTERAYLADLGQLLADCVDSKRTHGRGVVIHVYRVDEQIIPH